MKAKFVIALMTCLLSTYATAGDYTLTLNGVEVEIDLGKDFTVELPGGQKVLVTLKKKAIISFEGDYFKFDHPNQFVPARSDLGDGIFQTMLVSPLGSMVLIQEYKDIDPSSLVDFMVNELVKEEERITDTR